MAALGFPAGRVSRMFDAVSFGIGSIVFLCGTFSGLAKAQSREKDRICPSNQHWVQAYHRNAYRRADGTPVSAADVTAHCQDNPPAYAKWRLRLKDISVPPPWAKTEKRKNWTTAERERVYEALSDLPPGILLESVGAIYRSKEFAPSDTNPAAGDLHFIVLYDSAFSEGRNLSRILAHEFSHELFRQIPDDLRQKYAESNGWIPNRARKASAPYFPGRIDFVEEDGAESVTEDFANNIEYFMFEPEKLKKVSPGAHAWIQKMLGDKLKMGGGKK